MNMRSKYRHDCDACIELGQANEHDLYYCPQQSLDAPTLVARFGDDGPEYATFNPTLCGPPATYHGNGMWAAAYERALAKGLTFARPVPVLANQCPRCKWLDGEHSGACWSEQVREARSECDVLKQTLAAITDVNSDEEREHCNAAIDAIVDDVGLTVPADKAFDALMREREAVRVALKAIIETQKVLTERSRGEFLTRIIQLEADIVRLREALTKFAGLTVCVGC